MPPEVVRLGMVSCFIRSAGRTEALDEEAPLRQPPRLVRNDLLETSERLITTFDVIVGPSLDFYGVAAKSFSFLLTEWIHHSGASLSASVCPANGTC